MKIKYQNVKFNKASNVLLDKIIYVIDEYEAQGYNLTLRQLYYQLVSRDYIPNDKTSYQKIGRLVTKGRMGGLIDWDNIVDRLRVMQIPYSVTGIKHALQDTCDQYRLNRQNGQDYYVEVWTEKDAISGILYDVTSTYHIPLMVNRGYSSASAMHQAYKKRFTNAWHRGQKVVVLYLGDHDPSGLDMLRDINERITFFANNDFPSVYYKVIHVALTMDQVKQYNPPPNFAKQKDVRGGNYIPKYGNYSWEVDALEPKTLKLLVEEAIQEYVDIDKVNAIIHKEEKDRGELSNLGSFF